MPDSTIELFVVVTIYEKNKSFANVVNGYLRLCYAKNKLYGFESGKEIARFKLTEDIKTRGLVIARFIRSYKQWKF